MCILLHDISIWYIRKAELNIWYRNLCLQLQRSYVSRDTWPHPSFPQYGAVVLSPLQKSIPKEWCFHLHASRLGWCCPLEPLLLVFSGCEWNRVWSAAAVAHLWQGPSCAFWDAVLHTTVVLCRYVCLWPVSLHDSCHSPSTSLINKLFLSTGLPLTGCFFVLHHSR